MPTHSHACTHAQFAPCTTIHRQKDTHWMSRFECSASSSSSKWHAFRGSIQNTQKKPLNFLIFPQKNREDPKRKLWLKSSIFSGSRCLHCQLWLNILRFLSSRIIAWWLKKATTKPRNRRENSIFISTGTVQTPYLIVRIDAKNIQRTKLWYSIFAWNMACIWIISDKYASPMRMQNDAINCQIVRSDHCKERNFIHSHFVHFLLLSTSICMIGVSVAFLLKTTLFFFVVVCVNKWGLAMWWLWHYSIVAAFFSFRFYSISFLLLKSNGKRQQQPHTKSAIFFIWPILFTLATRIWRSESCFYAIDPI